MGYYLTLQRGGGGSVNSAGLVVDGQTADVVVGGGQLGVGVEPNGVGGVLGVVWGVGEGVGSGGSGGGLGDATSAPGVGDVEGSSGSVALGRELDGEPRGSVLGKSGGVAGVDVEVSSESTLVLVEGVAVGAGELSGLRGDDTLVGIGASKGTRVGVVVVLETEGSEGRLEGTEVDESTNAVSEESINSLNGWGGHSVLNSGVDEVPESQLEGDLVVVQSRGGVVDVVVVDVQDLVLVGDGGVLVGTNPGHDGSLVGRVPDELVSTEDTTEELGEVIHVVLDSEPGVVSKVSRSLKGAQVLPLGGEAHNARSELEGVGTVVEGSSDGDSVDLSSGNDTSAVAAEGDVGDVGHTEVIEDLPETSHEATVHGVNDDVLTAEGSNRVPAIEASGVCNEVVRAAQVSARNDGELSAKVKTTPDDIVDVGSEHVNSLVGQQLVELDHRGGCPVEAHGKVLILEIAIRRCKSFSNGDGEHANDKATACSAIRLLNASAKHTR
jgi:hypothetical protein